MSFHGSATALGTRRGCCTASAGEGVPLCRASPLNTVSITRSARYHCWCSQSSLSSAYVTTRPGASTLWPRANTGSRWTETTHWDTPRSSWAPQHQRAGMPGLATRPPAGGQVQGLAGTKHDGSISITCNPLCPVLTIGSCHSMSDRETPRRWHGSPRRGMDDGHASSAPWHHG